MSNASKFAIVFCVINLAALRNLSEILYLSVYVAVSASMALKFFTSVKTGLLDDAGRQFMLWISLGVVGFFVSLSVISPVGAATGMIRFLFAAPIFMALVVYTDSELDLRRHLVTAVSFFAVASLTLPLQFITGPITWFADASERAGFERYSTLTGSLTSLGIVVGSYLVLTLAVRGTWRWALILLIAFPALLALSKSAIANIVLAFVVIVYLNRRSLGRVVGITLAISGVAGVIYVQLGTLDQRLSATLQSFGIQNGAQVTNYDSSVGSSAIERLSAFPLRNFEALSDLASPLVYFVGGGFGMGNTALVPKSDAIAPMAHNQFAELMTVFGIVGGSVAIVIMISVAFKLARKSRQPESEIHRVLLGAYGLLVFNSLFANGTVYQPASASIFYFAMFAAASSKLTKDSVHGEPSHSRPDQAG